MQKQQKHSVVNQSIEEEELFNKMLYESSDLSVPEMNKYGPNGDVRWKIFLKKFDVKDAFSLKDGTPITIPSNENNKLFDAVENKNGKEYKDAFKAGVTAKTGNDDIITLKSPTDLQKTADFGGRGDSGSSAAGLNESVFADKVKALVAAAAGPITVVLGQKVIPGVTDAKQTGTVKVKGGQTSKADVVLETSKGGKRGKSGQVRLSIKMKTAEYYLSGDAALAEVAGPIVEDLLAKNGSNPPVPSIQKIGPRYFLWYGKEMVSGISFPISGELAQSSVFGEEDKDNAVDVVVKGDLTVDPVKNGDTHTYTWSDVMTYETLAEVPEDDQPVGLLRKGEEGRGFTYKREKYSGIRPAIVSKKRASSAYHYVPSQPMA